MESGIVELVAVSTHGIINRFGACEAMALSTHGELSVEDATPPVDTGHDRRRRTHLLTM